MKVVSVDIGEKNFAYSIIQFIKLPETQTPLIKVLKTFHYNILNETKSKQTILNSCIKLCHVLESDTDISECNLILIEQQMRTNIRAQRIAQHLWSYLYTKFIVLKTKPLLEITMVPSSLKTQTFLGSNTLKNKERKKWAISMILFNEIFTIAKTKFNIEVEISKNILETINNMPKKDDVCDTILQAIAYYIKHML